MAAEGWCDGFPRTELTIGERGYPRQLMDLDTHPERLYVLGDPRALQVASLSIAGARRVTPYGEAVSQMAGRVAAEGHVTVVTGGAVGCDSAAARAAAAAGGETVVVAGSGPDVAWPPASADVYEAAVRGGGAVVSAQPWGSSPRREAFQARNRVIAALAAATLVTEAGTPSGVMSLAGTAAGLGRRVYAVPGSILSPQSEGTNELIARGEAEAVTSESALADILARDFGIVSCRAAEVVPTPEADPVLGALRADAMRPGDLADRLGMGQAEALGRLASLEAAGTVVRLPDGRYSLTAGAYLGHGDTPSARQVVSGAAGAMAAGDGMAARGRARARHAM